MRAGVEPQRRGEDEETPDHVDTACMNFTTRKPSAQTNSPIRRLSIRTALRRLLGRLDPVRLGVAERGLEAADAFGAGHGARST